MLLFITRGLLIIRWVILCVYACECPWVEHHTYKPYSSPRCQGEPLLCFYPLLWKCFQFYFSFSHFPETTIFFFFFFFFNSAMPWQGWKMFSHKEILPCSIDSVSTSFLQQKFHFKINISVLFLCPVTPVIAIMFKIITQPMKFWFIHFLLQSLEVEYCLIFIL